MAQLQSIISSVLRDVLVAQHEANIYSMSLCESYRKDGHTELFPLPAIAIGEMELEIRYGIKAVAAQSIQFEINYPLLRKTVRKLTAQLAKVMLESVINSILSSTLAADKERIKLIEQLSTQTEINRKFSSFLDQKLQDSVIGQFTNLLKKKKITITTTGNHEPAKSNGQRTRTDVPRMRQIHSHLCCGTAFFPWFGLSLLRTASGNRPGTVAKSPRSLATVRPGSQAGKQYKPVQPIN